jgi:hypothetical protein
MHRRNFFAVASAALLSSCVPEIAPAKPAPVPHVFMSSSVAWTGTAFGPAEIETWRHSVDRDYVTKSVFLKDTPYAERHAAITQHYKEWKSGRQSAPKN